MLNITLEGKSLDTGDLKTELLRAISTNFASELRERISAIRHPETNEFPTVVVEGDSLNDMVIRVEGSSKLLGIIQSRMSSEDLNFMYLKITDTNRLPKVFLSYAWDDRELAQKIAQGLIAQGIDTWWAEWEIKSGDSIRTRIDNGLSDCSHFVVLLTPRSITRPWVNAEIDAGFMRKINEKSRFIPLRHALNSDSLPPLLSGILSPEVNADATDLQQLVNDIHGLSLKPGMGPVPTSALGPNTGYSKVATTVASLFVRQSQNGCNFDPQLSFEEIVKSTDLSEEDIEDALHELRNVITHGIDKVYPENSLFSEFDQFWMPWDPSQDAIKLATDMLNDDEFPSDPKDVADKYSWNARRLNPAITYLRERKLIETIDYLGSGPFVTGAISKSASTRRYVKSRK